MTTLKMHESIVHSATKIGTIDNDGTMGVNTLIASLKVDAFALISAKLRNECAYVITFIVSDGTFVFDTWYYAVTILARQAPIALENAFKMEDYRE